MLQERVGCRKEFLRSWSCSTGYCPGGFTTPCVFQNSWVHHKEWILCKFSKAKQGTKRAQEEQTMTSN